MSSVISDSTPPQEEEEDEEERGNKKKRKWPWTRPTKRNERKVKLGTRDPTQSTSHPKKRAPLNFPYKNYTMKEGVRKKDLTKLECGREELKLEREEMAKVAQTFEEPTFKDSPMTCMREIITTMQNMAIKQDKVNKNLVETIVGIVRSSLEKAR